MRAGRLQYRIAIQRATVTINDAGEPTSAWAAIGGDRWARKTPVSGTERYSAPALEALEQVEFSIRWSDDLADLRPADRIIEPASDATASPIPERSKYDIVSVNEMFRREELRITATRRTGAGG